MKNVILTPNPYRDRNFQTVRSAIQILKDAGIQPKLCLPFEVDRNYELPKDLRFSRLDRELPNAELVICFGGDGTILHLSKTAAHRDIPVLGVNLGSLGFMAELESKDLSRLRDMCAGKYAIESHMMLDVSVLREGRVIYSNLALNEALIARGNISRVIRLQIFTEQGKLVDVAGDGVIVASPTGSRRADRSWSRRRGTSSFPPSARTAFTPTPTCSRPSGSSPCRRRKTATSPCF